MVVRFGLDLSEDRIIANSFRLFIKPRQLNPIALFVRLRYLACKTAIPARVVCTGIIRNRLIVDRLPNLRLWRKIYEFGGLMDER